MPRNLAVLKPNVSRLSVGHERIANRDMRVTIDPLVVIQAKRTSGTIDGAQGNLPLLKGSPVFSPVSNRVVNRNRRTSECVHMNAAREVTGVSNLRQPFRAGCCEPLHPRPRRIPKTLPQRKPQSRSFAIVRSFGPGNSKLQPTSSRIPHAKRAIAKKAR